MDARWAISVMDRASDIHHRSIGGNEAAHAHHISAVDTPHRVVSYLPILFLDTWRTSAAQTYYQRRQPTHDLLTLPSFVPPSTAPYLTFVLHTHNLHDGVKEEGSSQGTAAIGEIRRTSLMRAGHYPRRQRGRQDQLDEPIRMLLPSM